MCTFCCIVHCLVLHCIVHCFVLCCFANSSTEGTQMAGWSNQISIKTRAIAGFFTSRKDGCAAWPVQTVLSRQTQEQFWPNHNFMIHIQRPKSRSVGDMFASIAVITVFLKRKILSLETILRARARTHTHTYMHTRTHTHKHARTHARTCTLSHTHTHARTHARAHTRAHTHTHTHTQAPAHTSILTIQS